MNEIDQPWFVYLLECTSGRIYTGVTPAVDRRIAMHIKGRGALFTKINRPTRLLAAKPFTSRHEAMKVEKQVKTAGAAEKRTLAAIWARQHPLDAAFQSLFVHTRTQTTT
jgi:predicted GIY-YIG superfamily endonuclease